jgi:thiamine-phosphate pyrophosphorylase
MLSMERALFRIIDANFNRGREAARTMEEYCRFALNSPDLSSRAKMLRHDLCSIIKQFDPGLLIANRDVQGDVGRQMRIEGQLCRSTLSECFVAAAKRLSEALRVLAEAVQTFDPAVAADIERLRFDGYALEKDALVFSSTTAKFSSVRLYVLLTAMEDSGDKQILNLARLCVGAGVNCLQLRCKGISDRRALHLAKKIVSICRAGGTLSIINDRIDIAVSSGADGVHLGQDDISVADARQLQMTPMIVGLSTHSIDQLKDAIGQQPDYVALGPVFATPTKPSAEPVGLEYVSKALAILTDSNIGHVAIGGITPGNIGQVLAAGARTIAVSSVVTEAKDPESICRQLKETLSSAP